MDFFNENQFHFKSKAGSQYFYTNDGVYRYSNHWGRVANCRWRLLSDKKVKSQNFYVGLAKWTSFCQLNETKKQFYISVDFDKKIVDFHHKNTYEKAFLFYADTAQKKVKQIRKLFVDDKWAKHFEEDISVLRKKIIFDYINSDLSLQEVKIKFK
ncbi:MAG: hypothetical protein P8H13_03970 [Polaribacter sp.]|nr:hypothetical protein [Polaribacter sp.]